MPEQGAEQDAKAAHLGITIPVSPQDKLAHPQDHTSDPAEQATGTGNKMQEAGCWDGSPGDHNSNCLVRTIGSPTGSQEQFPFQQTD